MGQTKAVRDYGGDGIACSVNDQIVLCADELFAKGTTPEEAVLAAFSKLPDMEDKESCLLFRGAGVDDSEDDALIEAISASYPLLEVNVEEGGQELYRWLIGLT